jgi:hypothetical protein
MATAIVVAGLMNTQVKGRMTDLFASKLFENEPIGVAIRDFDVVMYCLCIIIRTNFDLYNTVILTTEMRIFAKTQTKFDCSSLLSTCSQLNQWGIMQVFCTHAPCCLCATVGHVLGAFCKMSR